MVIFTSFLEGKDKLEKIYSFVDFLIKRFKGSQMMTKDEKSIKIEYMLEKVSEK